MSVKKSRAAAAQEPSPSLLREARETLTSLMTLAFESAEISRALARHEAVRDRSGLAKAFLRAWVAWTKEFPGDLELPTQFVTFLLLLVGQDTLFNLLDVELEQVETPEEEIRLLMLADLAGAEFEPQPDPGPLPRELAQPLLSQIAQGEEGFYQLAAMLLATPAPMREPLLAGLLQTEAHHPGLIAFVSFMLMTPLDTASHERLRGWLERQGGPAGAWVLDRLAGKAPEGPSPLPELPLDWPVLEAYATFPDGCGSQGLYLLRRRPRRRQAFAMASAVVSDWRGIADGVGHPSLTQKEHETLLAQVSGGAGLVRVPVAHLRGRLNAGLTLSAEEGLPLPFLFRMHWNLFAGLPQDPIPDVAALVTGWADLGRLPETARLGDEDFFTSWYLEDTGSARTREFFAEAGRILAPPVKPPRRGQHPLEWLIAAGNPEPVFTEAMSTKLDALIAGTLPKVFDDEARRAWQGRLAQVAYLYDQQGETDLRDLAATAALAIAPESGVPLTKQPFAHHVLHQSAFKHAAQQDEERFEDFFGPLLAPSGPPARAPEPKKRATARAKAKESDSVYELEIRLLRMRPPVWRRVLVPGDFSLWDLHDMIQVVFGWDDDHLHAFTIGHEEFGSAPDGSAIRMRRDSEVSLAQVAREGEAFAYEYDFGAGWQHRITVKRILVPAPNQPYPYCLAGKGTGPEQQDEGFDLDEVNAMLAVLAKQRLRSRR